MISHELNKLNAKANGPNMTPVECQVLWKYLVSGQEVNEVDLQEVPLEWCA